MARFITREGIILNQLNGKNMRNIQQYKHVITWMFESNEVYVSARIVDDSETHIPKGLERIFAPTSLTLQGLPTDVDTYHPLLINYLSKNFKLDGTEYKTEDSDIKATLDDVREQDMHYTGRSWGNKGIAGYYKDGNTLSFDFQVEVTYDKIDLITASRLRLKLLGNFTIIAVPNMNPNIFCFKYGRDNGFTDETSKKIGYDEYKTMMTDKGFNFLTIDYSKP